MYHAWSAFGPLSKLALLLDSAGQKKIGRDLVSPSLLFNAR
jgi:hypothetical protein